MWNHLREWGATLKQATLEARKAVFAFVSGAAFFGAGSLGRLMEKEWGVSLTVGGGTLAFVGFIAAYHNLRLSRDEARENIRRLVGPRSGAEVDLPACLKLETVEPRRGELPDERTVAYELRVAEELPASTVLEFLWTAPVFNVEARLVSSDRADNRRVKHPRKREANRYFLWFPGPPVEKDWILQVIGTGRDGLFLERVALGRLNEEDLLDNRGAATEP